MLVELRLLVHRTIIGFFIGWRYVVHYIIRIYFLVRLQLILRWVPFTIDIYNLYKSSNSKSCENVRKELFSLIS